MNRGTLNLAKLTMLVLDEADEMLQMGFIDAVESILEQTPPGRQVALFSATLAPAIRRIAQRHLRTPVEVTIRAKTGTSTRIRQRCWMVSGLHKLDALTRILETETFDGMLIFTRTKQSTVELAEKLEARGFSAAALNGDIPQAQRERTVARLRAGEIDIVVATDVAARGLDVERISHVVNYDAPYDGESYVHRIGRTGRAGRSGEAILFIAPREGSLLRAIERATRQKIEPMDLPTVDAVNASRVAKFKVRISETVAKGRAAEFRPILRELETETGMPLIDIAAALASLGQGESPLLLKGAETFRSDREARRRGEAGARNEAGAGNQACAGNESGPRLRAWRREPQVPETCAALSLRETIDSTQRSSDEQGHGTKERGQEETHQDAGREARREEGQARSARLIERAAAAQGKPDVAGGAGGQTTRPRRPPRRKSSMFAAISSIQRCRASRAAQAMWGVTIRLGMSGASKGSPSVGGS